MKLNLVKLNLGCGHRKIEGYVGVDANAKTSACDLACDLRTLPHEDGSVEEIIAVHVIEHFYLWEVQPLLAEWRRVLAPGGKLILEQPDIAKAAMLYLRNPADKGYMFAFYGDPGQRDERMCHHWGWTPATLGRELKLAGFRDPTHKPAQFKRPERDFRVEAIR